jgi:two-component system, LuxR family, response regulator FixJ
MAKIQNPAPVAISIPIYHDVNRQNCLPPTEVYIVKKIATEDDIARTRTIDRVIYIIDDDDAVRRSAAFMLTHAGFRTESYGSGAAFLEGADTRQSGSILLDISMPEMNGLEVLRKLNERCNTMPVIILTGSGEINIAAQAMRAGAVNFIEKPYEKETLLDAIHRANTEDDGDGQAEAADARSRVANLSGHERDVLDRLVAGDPNTFIAQDLKMAVLDVVIHRANVLEKLRVRSLAQALQLMFSAELFAK